MYIYIYINMYVHIVILCLSIFMVHTQLWKVNFDSCFPASRSELAKPSLQRVANSARDWEAGALSSSQFEGQFIPRSQCGWRKVELGACGTGEAHCRHNRIQDTAMWMDEIHLAPPKKPWNGSILQRKYEQSMVSTMASLGASTDFASIRLPSPSFARLWRPSENQWKAVAQSKAHKGKSPDLIDESSWDVRNQHKNLLCQTKVQRIHFNTKRHETAHVLGKTCSLKPEPVKD